MKTITPTPEEMKKRVARYRELEPLPVQTSNEVPKEVMDLIVAKELKPVITLGDDPNSPFGDKAPITDAAGITVTYASCPPGTGPTLHSHHKTFETFTVMKGKFEFQWGDQGEHSVTLGEFDAISVPPLVNRGFKNVGDGEGVLQVIISGGIHDRKDILFPKFVTEKIRKMDEKSLDFLRKRVGLEFAE